MLSHRLITALFNHRHALYADDLVYQLRDDLPHATVTEVEETLRRFKLAGLVDEQRGNVDSRWRLTDEAIQRATAVGLRVLAINAAVDGGEG